MSTSSATVDELRACLSALEKAHQALDGAATPEFLAGLVEGAKAGATGTGSNGPGAAPAHGEAGPAGGGGRSRAGVTGRRTKDAPLPAGPVRRGPWASLPAEQAQSLDPWLDLDDIGSPSSGLDDWYDREVAAGRFPQPTPEPAIDPTVLTIEALAGASLSRHEPDHLTLAVEHVAALRAGHEVMLVNLLTELHVRGSQVPRGLSLLDWVRTLDPTLTAAQAKAFVTAAAAFPQPRWARLRAAVATQQVTVAKAAAIIEFHDRAQRLTHPVQPGQPEAQEQREREGLEEEAQLEAVVEELTAQAQLARPEELARLIREELEQLTPPADADRREQAQRASRGLWFAAPNPAGMVGMRGLLDPDAAATVQSAIDALAKPHPERDECGHTIGPDPRHPARRRADALVDLIGRGVAAAAGVPVTDKAKVVVTISHDALTGRIRGTGLTLAGHVLTAAIVRRLACHAAIIPMVLGGRGEPMDVGRKERLVTTAMRIALNHRDQGCSFRGCTIPATWCDAHHVTPWYRGGPTKLRNLTLLCSRHHQHVHHHDLTATITATGVTWHE